MTLVLAALLAVVGVLMVTGSSRSSGSDLTLSATPTAQAVPAGGAARFLVEIRSSGRFTGSVQLEATGLPDGMLSSLSAQTVVLSKARPVASVEFKVSTLAATSTGTFQLGLLARGSNHARAVLLNLQIQLTSTGRAAS